MFELFRQGGWVMYPLLAFSVLSLAVMFERAVFYFSCRGNPYTLLEFFSSRWKQGGGAAALSAELRTAGSRSYWTSLVQTYFDAFDDAMPVFEEKLYACGAQIVRGHEMRLSVLASIASISPLIGLFGTVLGMIEVFQRLSALGGRADVALLSGGIWVALLTTAFGLLIAVPTLLSHQYFSRLVAERSENLDLVISRLNVITGKPVNSVPPEGTR
jgi:biopolymer transport protein ExbB